MNVVWMDRDLLSVAYIPHRKYCLGKGMKSEMGKEAVSLHSYTCMMVK